MDVLRLLQSMRVTDIEPQSRGPWSIIRQHIPPYIWKVGAFDEYPEIDPVMTSLCRWTPSTIDRFRKYGVGNGESVMSDDPKELRKHFPILMQAKGRVLVSGLGLGCIVRGLHALPQVEHIDVVEIDTDILAMIIPTLPLCSRIHIHCGDALTFPWPAGTRWDYAWHDVWSEKPHTQVLHMKLLVRYQRMAERQGAWGMPRHLHKLAKGRLLDSLL